MSGALYLVTSTHAMSLHRPVPAPLRSIWGKDLLMAESRRGRVWGDFLHLVPPRLAGRTRHTTLEPRHTDAEVLALHSGACEKVYRCVDGEQTLEGRAECVQSCRVVRAHNRGIWGMTMAGWVSSDLMIEDAHARRPRVVPWWQFFTGGARLSDEPKHCTTASD